MLVTLEFPHANLRFPGWKLGPIFLLLFWLLVACVLAVGGGLALSGAVAFSLPGLHTERQRAIRIARWVPAMGFAYLFICVAGFSLWSSARGRDVGWGDTWQTPVLGNYSLRMVNVTDAGTIFDRTDPDLGPRGSMARALGHRDFILGVRRMEVRGPYLLGTASPDAVPDEPRKGAETLFFILDTRTGLRTDLDSLAALQTAAQGFGGPLKLESIKAVYLRYRYGKADFIPLVAFAILPGVGLWFLMRWFRRLRADGGSSRGFFSTSGVQKVHSANLFLCSVNGVRRTPAGYSRMRG